MITDKDQEDTIAALKAENRRLSEENNQLRAAYLSTSESG